MKVAAITAIALATAVAAEANFPRVQIGHAAAEKRDVEERQLDSLFSAATAGAASVFGDATSAVAGAGQAVTSAVGGAGEKVTSAVGGAGAAATSAAGAATGAADSTVVKVGAVAVAGVAAGVVALAF